MNYLLCIISGEGEAVVGIVTGPVAVTGTTVLAVAVGVTAGIPQAPRGGQGAKNGAHIAAGATRRGGRESPKIEIANTMVGVVTTAQAINLYDCIDTIQKLSGMYIGFRKEL